MKKKDFIKFSKIEQKILEDIQFFGFERAEAIHRHHKKYQIFKKTAHKHKITKDMNPFDMKLTLSFIFFGYIGAYNAGLSLGISMEEVLRRWLELGLKQENYIDYWKGAEKWEDEQYAKAISFEGSF